MSRFHATHHTSARIRVLVPLLVSLSLRAVARDDTLGAWEDIRAIRVEGNQTFGDEEIHRSLEENLELLPQSHRLARREAFTNLVANGVQGGYRARGFAGVRVTVGEDPSTHALVIRVEEGVQIGIGTAVVKGDASVPGGLLVGDALRAETPLTPTEPLVELIEACRSLQPGAATNSFRFGWIRSREEASQRGPLALPTSASSADFLVAGDPVDWTSGGKRALTNTIRRVLANAGRTSGRFTAEWFLRPDSPVADLHVTFAEPTRSLRARKVRVTGQKICREEDIVDLIGVRKGEPITPALGAGIRRKLWRCGRFAAFEVGTTAVAGMPEWLDVTVEVEEYPEIRGLHEPLLPHERALLKLAGWLDDVVHDDAGDIRLDLRFASLPGLRVEAALAESHRFGIRIIDQDSGHTLWSFRAGADPGGDRRVSDTLGLLDEVLGGKWHAHAYFYYDQVQRISPDGPPESALSRGFLAGFRTAGRAEKKSPTTLRLVMAPGLAFCPDMRTAAAPPGKSGWPRETMLSFANARTGALALKMAIREGKKDGPIEECRLELPDGTSLRLASIPDSFSDWTKDAGASTRNTGGGAIPVMERLLPLMDAAGRKAHPETWNLDAAGESLRVARQIQARFQALPATESPGPARKEDASRGREDRFAVVYDPPVHPPRNVNGMGQMIGSSVISLFEEADDATGGSLSWARPLTRHLYFAGCGLTHDVPGQLALAVRNPASGPMGRTLAVFTAALASEDAAALLAAEVRRNLTEESFQREILGFIRGNSRLRECMSRLKASLVILSPAELRTLLKPVLSPEELGSLSTRWQSLSEDPDGQIEAWVAAFASCLWNGGVKGMLEDSLRRVESRTAGTPGDHLPEILGSDAMAPRSWVNVVARARLLATLRKTAGLSLSKNNRTATWIRNLEDGHGLEGNAGADPDLLALYRREREKAVALLAQGLMARQCLLAERLDSASLDRRVRPWLQRVGEQYFEDDQIAVDHAAKALNLDARRMSFLFTLLAMALERHKSLETSWEPDESTLVNAHRQRADQWRTKADSTHLHIISLTEADPAARLAVARDIENRLQSGEDFGQLAKKHSQDPRAPGGGCWSWVDDAKIAEPVRKAVAGLGRGKDTAIVELPNTTLVVRPMGNRPAGTVLPLQDVRATLITQLKQERVENAWREWQRRNSGPGRLMRVDEQGAVEWLSLPGP